MNKEMKNNENNILGDIKTMNVKTNIRVYGAGLPHLPS